MLSGSAGSPPISSARADQGVQPRTRRAHQRPIRTRLPQLSLRGRQHQAEENIPQALLDEAPVGCLSRNRNPDLLARRGDVQASVDQLAKANRDIAVSTIEGFGEERGDRVGGLVDDAGVALELITKPVVVIGQEAFGAV